MGDIITEVQDLTQLNWGLTRYSPCTAGTFLKSYSSENGHKTYYKLSDFDSGKGVVGHECINELIVDRLLTFLRIPHLKYSLIHADIRTGGKIFRTWVAASTDFKQHGEDKIPIETYYKRFAYQGESAFDFCTRMGWGGNIRDMLICDFLILNRDRHGANIEILRSRGSGKVRIAPLFDNGLSLLFSCKDSESLSRFNVLADRRVQSFVGGGSALKNLELIKPDELPDLPAFDESFRKYLFEGTENAMNKLLSDKMWEMISRRREIYENFCRKRRF